MGATERNCDRIDGSTVIQLPERCNSVIRANDISSQGIDEHRQMEGGDPWGSLENVGLRVPTLATPAFSADVQAPNLRYLFMLASTMVPAKACVSVIGLRQFWSVGALPAAGRFTELSITDPMSQWPDGNISWHLRLIPETEVAIPQNGPFNTAGFAFNWSPTPALLYSTATFNEGDLNANGRPAFYTTLTSYVPPKRGRPWGVPIGHLGTFYDLRFPWNDASSWQSLDLRVNGGRSGARIVFFASVRQTNPSTRIALPATAEGGGALQPGGLSPLELFGLNYSVTGRTWRVAGSIITEGVR